MMRAGRDVRGVFHAGRWNDLGTPERYLETHGQLLDDGYPGAGAARVLWGDDSPRGDGLCPLLRSDDSKDYHGFWLQATPGKEVQGKTNLP